ncbi:MAG: hypothetical protein Q8Q09_23960 [Deltaproteobacteria bacterium]|nr:hypothetical protein [Deltaproteobacteria bacterium]
MSGPGGGRRAADREVGRGRMGTLQCELSADSTTTQTRCGLDRMGRVLGPSMNGARVANSLANVRPAAGPGA